MSLNASNGSGANPPTSQYASLYQALLQSVPEADLFYPLGVSFFSRARESQPGFWRPSTHPFLARFFSGSTESRTAGPELYGVVTILVTIGQSSDEAIKGD